MKIRPAEDIWRFTRTDTIVTGGSLALLFVVSVALYLDFNRRVDAAGAEQIGVLVLKQNVAQRKYSNQVVWEGMQNEVPVYNRDSIRTGEFSSAVIRLRDNTEIELDENTLVILDMSSASTDVNFAYGSIQAKREGDDAGDTALNIKSEDKTITINDSDVKLNKGSEDAEELDVVVSRGEASVTTESGEEQTVGEDERASLKGDRIQVQKINLVQNAPGDGQRLFVQGANSRVTFRWSPVPGNPAVRLDLSRRRNFSAGNRSQTTGERTASLNVPAGVYYWRISAVNPQTRKREFSAVRKFSVVQSSALSLHAPQDGKTFSYVTKPPFINLGWSRNELATGYNVEVATDRSFNNIVESRRVQTTGTGVNLEVGTYFWRVRTESSFAGARVTSSARRFVVQRQQQVDPPAPRHPTGAKSIPRVFFEQEGVVFSWSRVNELRQTEVTLASDAAFNNPVASFKTDANFVSVKRSLAPGRYYWRLRGTDVRGNQTSFSASANFVVSETAKLSLVSPAQGSNIDEFTVRNEGVNFRWQKPELSGKYQLQVATNANFSNMRINEPVENRLNISKRDLPKGTYFWRVRLLSSTGGNVLSESDARSFTISNAFVAPGPVFPLNGAAVDMTTRDTLPFRWRPVAGADYYEVRVTKGGAVIANARVEDTDYAITDLTTLSKGAFRWSVRACRTARGAAECTQPADQGFRITLREPQVAPEITTPDTLYVVDDEDE